MHREALSRALGKCDVSGKCQPALHNKQSIGNCTVNSAHPKSYFTAYIHDICAEHTLQSLLLRDLKMQPLELPLASTLILDVDTHKAVLSLLPNSFHRENCALSSFQTPMLYHILWFMDRNIAGIIICD